MNILNKEISKPAPRAWMSMSNKLEELQSLAALVTGLDEEDKKALCTLEGYLDEMILQEMDKECSCH